MNTLTLTIANRNYSSWSLRAWLAMEATGAAFDEVMILLGRPDTPTEIAKHSPNGLVPALRDGDLVIWDSLAIAEYLAEKFPEAGLWPSDPQVRAIARSVVAEMHSGYTAVRGNMPMNIRASYPGAGRGPGVEKDIQRITSVWESCRRDFGEGGDLLFGGFTIADAFFAPDHQPIPNLWRRSERRRRRRTWTPSGRFPPCATGWRRPGRGVEGRTLRSLSWPHPFSSRFVLG